MKLTSRMTGPLQCFALGALLAAPNALFPSTAAASEKKEDARGFQEFSDRVHGYVKLHKSVEALLPELKTTDLPEMIVAHQQALARKIRQARPLARRGDVFTHEAREAFRHAIREETGGARGAHARATIKQGEPFPMGKEGTLKSMGLRVNDIYPEKVPFTTVPPTILLKLPKLPEEVAYRIIGPSLFLVDVKANMVVDFIYEVIH